MSIKGTVTVNSVVEILLGYGTLYGSLFYYSDQDWNAASESSTIQATTELLWQHWTAVFLQYMLFFAMFQEKVFYVCPKLKKVGQNISTRRGTKGFYDISKLIEDL